MNRQMKKLCETEENPECEKTDDDIRNTEIIKYSDVADGFVMRVIAENFRDKEAEEARQYLLKIRKFCDELLSSMDDSKTVALEDGADEEDNGYGSTEEFDTLQKNAEDSLEVKNRTKELGKQEAVTYIIRKRTGEKVVINRNLFKIGKDASYVDYCVKDNPAVSRNHADIVRKQDGFYLVDKGSLNRTFVDGKKLEAGEYRKLDDGCLLQLADDVFEFRSLKN